MLSDRKIYVLLITVFFTGLGWLLFQYINNGKGTPPGSTCLIKNISGIPCPSCGSTRAAVSILHGDLAEGIFLNPLGLIVLIIMAGILVLALFDLIRSKRYLPSAFRLGEKLVVKKPVALILILIIAANWGWNIIKGL